LKRKAKRSIFGNQKPILALSDGIDIHVYVSEQYAFSKWTCQSTFPLRENGTAIEEDFEIGFLMDDTALVISVTDVQNKNKIGRIVSVNIGTTIHDLIEKSDSTEGPVHQSYVRCLLIGPQILVANSKSTSRVSLFSFKQSGHEMEEAKNLWKPPKEGLEALTLFPNSSQFILAAFQNHLVIWNSQDCSIIWSHEFDIMKALSTKLDQNIK